ncbi:MAG: rhodanese-like domain-containing protein [Myxococcales bacterium]|nr:rhodanese-like domain-containing protein [Myxococcales bacterium]
MPSFKEIDVDALPGRPASWRLVDVRQPEEFRSGHVPGAELVPLSTVPLAAANWDKSQPIALICQVGGRSARAALHLSSMGFVDVMNVRGGTGAYVALGLPVER